MGYTYSLDIKELSWQVSRLGGTSPRRVLGQPESEIQHELLWIQEKSAAEWNESNLFFPKWDGWQDDESSPREGG
jgi:hypothetical protein